MPIDQYDNHKFLTYSDKDAGKYFMKEFTADLLREFTKKELNSDNNIESIRFAFEWYTNKLSDFLSNIKEVAFYQSIFWLHEHSSYLFNNNRFIENYNKSCSTDFAMYRRILKIALEYACELDLTQSMKLCWRYFNEQIPNIEKVLFLGNMAFGYSYAFSQTKIIGKSFTWENSTPGIYKLANKGLTKSLIVKILSEYESHRSNAIIDEDSDFELDKVLSKAFGVGIKELAQVVYDYNHYYRNEPCLLHKGGFLNKIGEYFNSKNESIRQYLKGLSLHKDNKLSLNDSILKPYNPHRFLLRPILIWRVDGEYGEITGIGIIEEAIYNLTLNAIGWNNIPSEWKVKQSIKDYFKSKKERNDKLLEDQIQKELSKHEIKHDRHVTELKKWNNQNLSLLNKKCGQIDFLFLLNGTVYIAECKHLIGRYDMNNWRNDYSYFNEAPNHYNNKLQRKKDFLKEKKELLEEHFQVIYKDRRISLSDFEVDCFFIVNTPTFIMYNNPIRILSLKWVYDFLENGFIEDKICLKVSHNDCIEIEYPYFDNVIKLK